MVVHWSLRDSESSLDSRTLLSILTYLNNTVVSIVSTHPPISNSFNHLTKPSGTVASALIIIIIIIYSFRVFHINVSWWFFPWSLSDSKSSQVSKTLLKILAVLSNAVVWIVSTRPPISKSSRLFNNPLVLVPKAPITIGTIITFMFHSFFNSLARSRYLSFFSLSFRFILWSTGTAKSTIFLLIIIRSGLLHSGLFL